MFGQMSDNWEARTTDLVNLALFSRLIPKGVTMSFMPQSPSSPLTIEPISMRVPDACRFTGISRSTLYLLIARGEIEIVKVGAATLVLTDSLRDLIERQRGTFINQTAIPLRPKSE
jgi:excisionase family DNA binding protein